MVSTLKDCEKENQKTNKTKRIPGRHRKQLAKLKVFIICVLCLATQSCLILCNPMDDSLPGSSVPGILQARILEWVVMPCSTGSSQPQKPLVEGSGPIDGKSSGPWVKAWRKALHGSGWEVMGLFPVAAATRLTLMNRLLLSRGPWMPITPPSFPGVTPAHPLSFMSGITSSRNPSLSKHEQRLGVSSRHCPVEYPLSVHSLLTVV